MTTREEAIKLAEEANATMFLAPYYIAAIERLIQLAKNEAYREAANITIKSESRWECEAAILNLVKE